MIERNPTGTPVFTSDELLTVSEVAVLISKHRDTVLKEYLPAGRYPNAVKETGGRGSWRIPVKDLVAAGDLDASAVADVAPRLETLRESRQVADLKAEIVELQKALEVEAARAAERKLTINTLEAILTAVMARPIESVGALV